MSAPATTSVTSAPFVPSRLVVGAALVAALGIEALLAWRVGFTVALAPYGFLGVVAVVLAACDLATRRLPNAIVLPSAAVAIGLLALTAGVEHDWAAFTRAVEAMVLVGGVLLIGALICVGQLGLGDVQVGTLVGLYCGFVSWPSVFLGVLLAFTAEAIVFLPRVIIGRLGWRAHFPFGPCLLVGAIAMVLLR